jgi:SPP1 family phage portal protein
MFTGIYDETKSIISQIQKIESHGQPTEQFLIANLNDWMKSNKRKLMLQSQSYFNNDNDIDDKKRWMIGRKGEKIEDLLLTNTKLPHPFMRKLVNQKIAYLLSKKFTIDCDNEAFIAAIEPYLNDDFYAMLKNEGKDAIKNGIGWLQVYYNKLGKLAFKRLPPEELYPFWGDMDHTVLEAVIRMYTVVVHKDTVRTEIKKVEYYDATGVYYFEYSGTGLKADSDKVLTKTGNFIVEVPLLDANGNLKFDEFQQPIQTTLDVVWDNIPLVAFKYNAEETSLLKFIKPLIDNYDSMTSAASDNIQDTPNNIKVVKNYDGTDKGEFVHNMSTYKTVFVSGDGDMTSVDTPIDMSAAQAHITQLRKDIFEFGAGVDSQQKDIGNASGVFMKFLYADLDLDCEDIGNEFMKSLKKLIWFMQVDMKNKGIGDFMDVAYEIIFNTDVRVNEAETILNIMQSVPLLSKETLLAQHPYVINVKKELVRKAADDAEELAKMEEIANFGTEPAATQ